ncbi:GNAT family N-acetyltransferase [Flavobacteriaceae bacterium XHP0103]|uniref:GNAT family N-acetyltransferase n=1 Tax=Marixanthotalea marina TaxID=2844359 RepID=UPI002989C25E|nr:GNAT family N-acetyltransferase [Marixanthotalea marina]MBU3822306.1 GNAT family N-acetyltransferase [Marixanthotalea marina]
MNEIIDLREYVYTLNKLPDLYESLRMVDEDFILLSNDIEPLEPTKNIIIVKDIPRYFDIKNKSLSKGIKHLCTEQYSGFSINFKNVTSTDDYLKSRFGSSSRYKLRRSIKKLEKCFDINYKMYFGEMSKQDYDFIFEEFFRLLEIRSIEKGILNNRNLKRKSYYHELVYNLILQKKASFYVIYNGYNPIDICLNFHLNDIVYQLIRTYDINYSKFNTGYVDLIKQIDWCIENHVSFINFSYGDFYWKRRWCNSVYKYDSHIFYNSKSIKSIASAYLYNAKIKIKHILRENKIIDKYHEIKLKIHHFLNTKKEFEIEVIDIDFNRAEPLDCKIDFYKNDYNFLRRYIYEFLFNFNEEEKDIKVYKLLKPLKSFLVIGKKNKIIINVK